MRVLALLVLAATSVAAQAIPDRCRPMQNCGIVPPMMRQHIDRTASTVRITLDGRVLRYEITETFVNRGSGVGEADYLLPLPRGAAFEDLALEINGELVTGETMDAARASGIYQEIVRQVKDPALVEWMGSGLLRTRIFPIAPGETKKVVVRFRAVAQREGPALRVEYLAGGKTAGSIEANAAPTLTMRINDAESYGTPYSPTHRIDVRDRGTHSDVQVRGDASRLTLLLPVRESSRAVITPVLHAPGNEDGFALITVSPPARATKAVARDITLVLDVSGSMAGRKLEQAKAAGKAVLGTLGPQDRIRLIAFSTDVDQFRSGWTTAAGGNLRAAEDWLDALRATGGTNIEEGLRTALDVNVPASRLGVVLFVTDGAATVGMRDAVQLADLAAEERNGQRVFTFGVGADVQAAMLERVALEGRGTAHFVQPTEDVEYVVGVVAQRLTAPVATNLVVRANGVTLRQIQPDGKVDLFAGQDLVLFARYRGDGAATITVEGESPEGPVRWTQRVTFPERSRDNAFVAKLWAVQRVGWLSAERRRAGASAELDDELRTLGNKYGIPTELSSYLVVEPGMQTNVGAAAGGRGVRAVPLVERGTVGSSTTAGRGAFEATRAAAEQRAATSLADATAPASAKANATQRMVGDRSFELRDGRWTDSRVRDSVRTVTVVPFSPAYFALLRALPELQPMFALGDRVSVGGRQIVLMLDAKGVTQLDAAAVAAVIRDW
jgi:Ca-activated chloride channel family protein